MCVICIDWEKGKMTNKEALSALNEIIESDKTTADEFDHYLDLEDRILDKEDNE